MTALTCRYIAKMIIDKDIFEPMSPVILWPFNKGK